MSTVYIAASQDELERVRVAAQTLKRGGIRVTATWWRDDGRLASPNPMDKTLRLSQSQRDLLELESAEVLWLLVPPLGCYGHEAFVELGFALALGKRVISSGPALRSIFCSLTSEFTTDEEALEYLTRPYVPTAKMGQRLITDSKV